MASYRRNLIKEDESEVSGTLLMKGIDSEPIKFHYSLQNSVDDDDGGGGDDDDDYYYY